MFIAKWRNLHYLELISCAVNKPFPTNTINTSDLSSQIFQKVVYLVTYTIAICDIKQYISTLIVIKIQLKEKKKKRSKQIYTRMCVTAYGVVLFEHTGSFI